MRANAPDRPNFYLIGKKSWLPITVIGNVGNVISSPVTVVYIVLCVIKIWLIFFTPPLHARIFWPPHLKQVLFFSYPTIFSSAPTPAINNDRSLIHFLWNSILMGHSSRSCLCTGCSLPRDVSFSFNNFVQNHGWFTHPDMKFIPPPNYEFMTCFSTLPCLILVNVNYIPTLDSERNIFETPVWCLHREI
jgi:hypothetical protein